MMNMVHKTDEGISKISASYYGKDATRDYLGNGQYPNANSLYYDNSTCLFMNASHKLTTTRLKGLGAGFIYSRKTGGLGEFWMFQQNQTYPVNEITWEQVVPYLKYERKFSEKVSFNSYIKGNMSTERAYTGGYQQTINPAYGNLVMSNYNIRVYDKELFGEVKYNVSSKTNLIAGVNGITRHSSGSPESYAVYIFAGPGVTFQPDSTYYPSSSSYHIYSGFTQIQHDINFLKGLSITAGTRYDLGRVYSAYNGSVTNKVNHLSPRVALVQKVTDNFNVKFMYGNAFRAPLIKEVGLNEEARATALSSSTTAGNVSLIPNVKPESISTLEGALTFTTHNISLSGTCFYNVTKNSLGAITIAELNNARVFSNSTGMIKAKGFEAEVQILPVRNLMLKANYSYAKATDSLGNQLGNVPTSKLNGIATYSIMAPEEISFTLVGRWIANYRSGVVHPFLKNNGFAQDNSLMPGFKVFDLNIVGKVTNTINVELQVRNLLNTKIITPTGIVNSGMLNVPYPGRSFLVTMAFKF
jgi:outer membrane receptor for ferrienterochelin and colicin